MFKTLFDSIKTDSNVSSIRLQGWFAILVVYGVWVMDNIVNAVKFIQAGGMGQLQIVGYTEIIALTGAVVAGKVVQAFSKNDSGTDTNNPLPR